MNDLSKIKLRILSILKVAICVHLAIFTAFLYGDCVFLADTDQLSDMSGLSFTNWIIIATWKKLSKPSAISPSVFPRMVFWFIVFMSVVVLKLLKVCLINM